MMTRALLPVALTGAFRVSFSIASNVLQHALNVGVVLALSGASGFPGNLFALTAPGGCRR